jgi:hypothetical protein
MISYPATKQAATTTTDRIAIAVQIRRKACGVRFVAI